MVPVLQTAVFWFLLSENKNDYSRLRIINENENDDHTNNFLILSKGQVNHSVKSVW